MSSEAAKQARLAAALKTVQQCLTELEWEPKRVAEGSGFSVDFGPPHLPVSGALAAISSRLEAFVFYFNFGFAVDAASRPEMAEFIARVNSELMVGNLDLDVDRGYLRFKVGLSFQGTDLSPDLIRGAIRIGMTTVEKYAETLMQIARGEIDCAAAIAMIKKAEAFPVSE